MRLFQIRALLLIAAAALLAPDITAQNLQTASPVVSQFEDGQPFTNAQRAITGEIIFFRFAAVNFKTGPEGKIQLVAHAQLFDPRGTPAGPSDELALATSLRDEDKEYQPRFHFQFQVPSIAPPGAWRIKYEVTDLQSKQQAQAETTFAVDGRSVPPAESLTVRNFAFFRGQDDETALKVAAYRPGDMVWVRFDVTGYKYGEQNAMDVSYDVAVKSSEGKPMFTQENAAAEKSQAYYPQPWVPAVFSLSLQPTMRPGAYTIAITAKDDVGKQTAVAEAQFRVE